MIRNIRLAARRAVMTVLGLYWLLIFASTHIPMPAAPDVDFTDKIAHFLAYSGLGFLLGWSVLRMRPTWSGAFVVFTIFAAYGAADEISQTLVPTRSMDIFDWIADLAGGSAGLSVYYVSQRIVAGWLNPSCRVANLAQNDIA